jgi:hypothetical protein
MAAEKPKKEQKSQVCLPTKKMHELAAYREKYLTANFRLNCLGDF